MSVDIFVFQCLSHPWLRAKETMEAAVIKTENLKRYLVRRRWVRYGQVIKAANRLSGDEIEVELRVEIMRCVGMFLRSSQDSLDHNGNKSEESKESEESEESEDREESLLEKRLKEEFSGKERVNVKMTNIAEIDR